MLNKNTFKIGFIGWMVCITLLSLFSFSGMTDMGLSLPNTDKLVHFIFHFGIVLLGALAFVTTFDDEYKLKTSLIKLFFFSLAYGLGIELLQFLMPFGRFADIWDVLANTSGALTAVLLIKKYRLRIQRIK